MEVKSEKDKALKTLALYAVDAVKNGNIKVNLKKKDGRVVLGAAMFYKELPASVRQVKAYRKSYFIVVFTDRVTGSITDIRTYYAPKKVPPKH